MSGNSCATTGWRPQDLQILRRHRRAENATAWIQAHRPTMEDHGARHNANGRIRSHKVPGRTLSLGPISMFRLGLLDLVLMYLYFPLDYVKGSLPSPMFVVVAGALLLVAPVGFIAWTWFARKSDQIPLHTLLMYASLCIFYPFKLYSQINAPAQSSAGNFAIMPQEYPVSVAHPVPWTQVCLTRRA